MALELEGTRRNGTPHQALPVRPDRRYIEIAALLRQERRLGVCQSKKAAHVTGGQLQCLRIAY
jgi:hypothetical protein